MQQAPAASPRLAERPSAPRGGFRLSATGMAYLLNAPAIILIMVLTIYPVISAFWISLHEYSIRKPDVFRFVGLQNYLDLLETGEFWNALWVTLLFTFWTTVLVLFLALVIGLLLNEPFRGRGFIRALILLPWAMPDVANALMWQWIYNGHIGILNGALWDLGIIEHYRAWLVDEATMYPAIIFANVWNSFPFSALIILAALQSIPGELYDSARVDRASVFNRFRYITLPWLVHPVLIILILQALGGIRIFGIIYLLTGGGPGTATTTIGYAAYQTAFLTFNFGLGNAYSYVIALITLIIMLIYMRLLWNRGDIAT